MSIGSDLGEFRGATTKGRCMVQVEKTLLKRNNFPNSKEVGGGRAREGVAGYLRDFARTYECKCKRAGAISNVNT